jgi:hypothetical protein
MRRPDPLILVPGGPFGDLLLAASISLPPILQYDPALTSDEAPPNPLPTNFHPSEFLIIPPYDPLQVETPTQYDHRFDDVLYGDTPAQITDAHTRFILNNPNGVSRDGVYDHLTEYLMELLDLGIDVILLSPVDS